MQLYDWNFFISSVNFVTFDNLAETNGKIISKVVLSMISLVCL